MAYGSTAGVQALLPALGTLGAGTLPTAAQVSAWLAQGAAIIDRHLTGAGYTVPVPSTATVYDELAALNDLYASAIAAQARGLDTVQGSEENRSSQWLERFYSQLRELAGTNLPDMTRVDGTSQTYRRFRTTQIKRVDGYSAPYDDDTEMDA